MFALINRERQRLLAIDVFARLYRTQVDQRVPMIGRAVDDDVDVVALHQFSKVAVDRRLRAVASESLGRLFRLIRIHVAHRDNVAEAPGISRIAAPLAPATHQRKAGAVVRAGPLRRGRGQGQFALDEPGGQTGCGRRRESRFQKSAA